MKTIWVILFAFLSTTVIVGGGTYYLMNAKAIKDKNNFQSQIDDLNIKLSAAKKSLADEQASSTTAATSQTVPTSTTPTSDPTADWKTYSNSSLGFSIKYPTSWNLVSANMGPEMAYLQSPQNATAVSCKSSGCTASSSVTISDDAIVSGVQNFLQQQSTTYSNVRSATIGNASGFSADRSAASGGGTSYLVQSQKDSHEAIELWFSTVDSDYSSSNTTNILSTFQLLR